MATAAKRATIYLEGSLISTNLIKGDIYEGLLEKNDADTKPGRANILPRRH